MALRPLLVEEWSRLAGLPGTPLGPWQPDPATAVILVEEDGPEIVGLVVAVNTIHLEALWVHPLKRRKFVLARLYAGVKSFLANCGVSSALCWSDHPTTGDYFARLGMTKMPVETYLMRTR